MVKYFLVSLILLLGGCSFKNPFNFSSDYRTFPIAVDCEKAADVSLTFQKEGLPTIRIGENNVEFLIIENDKGQPRPICIFNDMTLLNFCEYKGPEEVAPYWVSAYHKINAVKCKEILK